MLNTETPIVFTSKGNVPQDTLDYHHEWVVNEDVIRFREFYTEKATGEIVRDSTHIYLPKGAAAGAVAGGF